MLGRASLHLGDRSCIDRKSARSTVRERAARQIFAAPTAGARIPAQLFSAPVSNPAGMSHPRGYTPHYGITSWSSAVGELNLPRREATRTQMPAERYVPEDKRHKRIQVRSTNRAMIWDANIEQQARTCLSSADIQHLAMTWRDYHEVTKHSVASLRQSRHVLDWANMPHPFRHYEGVPVLDLPADPPAPEIPALNLLNGLSGTTPAAEGATFLSQLLFYSAAISASKIAPSTGYRYALRVNPSSGNLHPTEFHFLTHGVKEWPDGLYHYRPSAHMAEQRALGNVQMKWTNSSAPITFVLTSIASREAWKYRDRAYRYCLHDIGHAWQALALSAQAIGCDSFAVGHFADDGVAQSFRLHHDEWPILIVELHGRSIPLGQRDTADPVWYGGQPNQLSHRDVLYRRIHQIHSTTKLQSGAVSGVAAAEPASNGTGEMKLPPPASSARPFGEVARGRRSALDFIGGAQSMSFAQLSAVLAAAIRPLSADFAGVRFIQLYLYAHRVEGLQAGLYRVWGGSAELEQIKSGDQRVQAAGLSLGQDLAGNACVAFSMIADIERAVRSHGERGYRYVHFEAGAIGHRLYAAAEAFGLGATGIGAFYDDRVHEYLEIVPEQGQVVYHFAIGYPVPDPRLEG